MMVDFHAAISNGIVTRSNAGEGEEAYATVIRSTWTASMLGVLYFSASTECVCIQPCIRPGGSLYCPPSERTSLPSVVRRVRQLWAALLVTRQALPISAGVA